MAGPIAHHLIRYLANLCFAGATLGCIYMLLASVLVSRLRRDPSPRARSSAPVTILKPLQGAEPRLFAQLASFCNQNYRGPVQIVFGTHDEGDPAMQVVERLKAAFPDKMLDCRCDTREHGRNRKISNLVNMAPLARHDILIVADSAIQVGPNYLAEVVGELDRPGVGAVTCLYHGIAGAGFWSRLSAIAINTHFLPEVLVALNFRIAQPCFSATIAMRRRTLHRIGGFSSFAEDLAEDFRIGEAVRLAGYELAIPSFSVGHVCSDTDFASFLRQQMRFARTIRSIDPIGYAGSIVAFPLPLALMAALLGSSGTLDLLAAVLASRIILCSSVTRVFRLAAQAYWLIAIQDLISFVVYVGSFFGTRAGWERKSYRVLKNDRLRTG
jgi:ceramide glucosyltransferase